MLARASDKRGVLHGDVDGDARQARKVGEERVVVGRAGAPTMMVC